MIRIINKHAAIGYRFDQFPLWSGRKISPENITGISRLVPALSLILW
jgi:hypothetical protein